MMKTAEKQVVNKTGEKQNSMILSGVVVSTKMKDTIVVAVTRFVKHSKYKKYLKITKRFKAHDKGNVCVEGDTATIRECRPISKDKHFIVVDRKPKTLGVDISDASEDVSDDPKLTANS